MRDFSEDVAALRSRLEAAEGYLKADELRARRPELETEASRPDLWDDPDKARKVTGELAALVDDLDLVDRLTTQVDDVATLAELAREEKDESLEPEIDEAHRPSWPATFDELELRALFQGEYDERDAVVEVHSGAGGTDSQDWAEMLARMYQRWAERKGFKVEMEEAQAGQEAGISSATFKVQGRHAYGWLQGEGGVHRLIRISPVRQPGPPPHGVRLGHRRARPRRGRRRRRDRREGPAHRHLPVVGRRWPARQRDRLGGAHHPPAHRHRHVLPEPAQPAPEPGQGDGDPEGPPGRPAAQGAPGRTSTSWRATSAAPSGPTRSVRTSCTPSSG